MDDKQIFENRKHKHLTLDDRCIIQEELLKEKTFKEIGQRLGKDPSTISKEVRRNLTRILPKSFGRQGTSARNVKPVLSKAYVAGIRIVW